MQREEGELRASPNSYLHIFLAPLHSYGMQRIAFRRNATLGRNKITPPYPAFRRNAPYDTRCVDTIVTPEA